MIFITSLQGILFASEKHWTAENKEAVDLIVRWKIITLKEEKDKKLNVL